MSKTAYFEVDSDGKILRGMKHISEQHKEIAFILVHGYFSSNKIGPHRLYVNIANEISSRYGDCYRCDLTGMGESDGDITNVTLDAHIKDLKNILQHVTNDCRKDIIIISHSMGCNLVLGLMQSASYRFRGIIFLAPFFGSEEIFKNVFHQSNQIKDLETQGYTYRNGLYADKSFFDDNTHFNSFIKAINTSKTAINIIAAKSDQFIPLEMNELLRKTGENVTFVYIDDCDHNFLTKQSELIKNLCEIIENN